MADLSSINPHDGMLEQLAGSVGVIVATDGDRNENLAYARRAGALLAAELGVGLTLYDRSAETWTETPHNHRICDLDTARELNADHLVGQIQEAIDLGAPSVSAFQSSIPNFDGFTDAVKETGADVIVAPSELDHPKMIDRLQIPGGDLIAKLVEIEGDRHVVVAEPDGTLRLAD